MRTAAVLLLCLASASCAEDDDIRVEGPDRRFETPADPLGPPVSCISRADIAGTNVPDDRTIDFRLRSGETYRNRLPYACVGLARDPRFTYRTQLARLCSTDTITLARRDGGFGSTCGLGQFQPVALTPRPAPQ